MSGLGCPDPSHGIDTSSFTVRTYLSAGLVVNIGGSIIELHSLVQQIYH